MLLYTTTLVSQSHVDSNLHWLQAHFIFMGYQASANHLLGLAEA